MNFNLTEELTKDKIVQLLTCNENDETTLFDYAEQVKEKHVGKLVYFRGLIEYSNRCSKNCFYCGIRASAQTHRYEMLPEEVLECARYAWENKYGSIVIQAGERINKEYREQITTLIKQIKKLSNGELGITLSLGEQDESTYSEWFDAGAHRYLIRIEVSDPELYHKIHPEDKNHSFEKRLEAIETIKKIGYQAGTGVMIGLPFQTTENLANDLLFFKKLDIDMVGMGPYIEHEDTPLYQFREQLLSKKERLSLALRMVAILRILMPNINIAATTAMQAIDPMGREKAIKIGANVIMPNLTPARYRGDYLLYEDKPCLNEDMGDCGGCLEARIAMTGNQIGYGNWGDSKHFASKKK